MEVTILCVGLRFLVMSLDPPGKGYLPPYFYGSWCEIVAMWVLCGASVFAGEVSEDGRCSKWWTVRRGEILAGLGISVLHVR